MPLEKLWWDYWNGPVYDEHEVQAPQWEDVEKVIRALDADGRTMVRLLADDDVELMIGGGDGQFVITAVLDEDKHMSIRDAGRSDNEVELTVGGQTGIYTGQMIWDLDTALRAARLFWQDNVLDPKLPWSEP